MNPIDSVDTFVKTVTNDYKSWKTKTYPWFRGEPSVTPDPLVPRIYREKNADGTQKFIENQVVQFFRMKAPSLVSPSILPPREYNDQWLFLMQHFRLPTRLLDWTEGALVALFFALQEESDAAVWMLDPCGLNRLTCGPELADNQFPITWGNAESQAVKNIQAAWVNGEGSQEFPVAIHPTNIHVRLNVQRSCFTVHGSFRGGIDECIIRAGSLDTSSVLKKYEICGKNKKEMLEDLRLLGTSYVTVFPDIEGLSKELQTSSSRITVYEKQNGVGEQRSSKKDGA